MPNQSPLKTLILTQSQIEKLIIPKKVILAVEDAFKQYALDKAHMPAKIYLDLKKFNGDFRAMPAYIESTNSCSLKWVNAHPDNQKYGLPAVMAVLILNDPRTGFPLSIMDATYLTGIRTGAAGAVAVKHLTSNKPKKVALVGCGVQARTQLLMLREVRSISEVKVWGHEEKIGRTFIKDMKIKGEPMSLAHTIKDCVEDADIIVTTTPVRKPIVRYEWIKKGAHINAMGADAEGKQELDPTILKNGYVIIDDWDQASHSGEINVPLAKGVITKRKVYSDLGRIIAKKKSIPKMHKKISVFDSTGLAIQDAAVAQIVYSVAKRKKVGRPIQLF